MSYTKYVITKLEDVRDNDFGHGKISFQEKGGAGKAPLFCISKPLGLV